MTKCTKCPAELPEGSKYCNQCGSAQDGSPGAAPAASPGIPGASGRPPDEPEQPVWKGGVSAKAFGHWWLLYLLWVGVIAWLALFQLKPQQPWLRWTFVGIIGAPALWIGWITLFAKLTTRYRLTTHRFFKETGFVSRKLAELELMRVDDVQVTQNIIQRIFNVGRVTLITTDATDPRLEIDGIENPIQVKEDIRTNVRKRRGKAIHMESL